MKLNIREIPRTKAFELIEENDLDFLAIRHDGVLGPKYIQKFRDPRYSFYVVEDEEGVCLAIQVTQPLANGIKLESIQKVKGAPHGIFKFVSDYFSNIYNYIELDACIEALKRMYISYGYKQISSGNDPSKLALIYENSRETVI